MTIKQQGGIFGRNPTFNDVEAQTITVTGTITSDSLAVDTNTLYVDSTNNRVGIGVSSPSTALHTNVTGGDNELRIATTTSGNPTLALYANGAGAHAIAFDRSALALTFKTVGSSERMRISANGDVGIGTSSPGSRLSIVGLPTSSAGLSAGDVYNDGGTLKIV